MAYGLLDMHGHAGSSGTDYGPDSIGPPLSKWWALLPLLAGAVFAIATFSEHVLVSIFGKWCPDSLSIPCVFAGFVLMTSAVPTYYIWVVASSDAFKAMLMVKIKGDREFMATFKKRMDRIVRDALLDMLGMMFLVASVCFLAFETMTSAALFAPVSGAISFTTRAQLSFLNRIVELCDKDIDIYIAEHLPATGTHSIDWQVALKEHYLLDVRIERLWGLDEGGMILLPLVGREVVLGSTLLAMGVILQDPMHKLAAWLIGTVLIFRGIWALQGPARITRRCTDASTSSGRDCIKAAANVVSVNRILTGRRTTEAEEVTQMRFVQYLNTTTSGVELHGVPITFTLVLQLITRAATGLPIAVGLLENISRM